MVGGVGIRWEGSWDLGYRFCFLVKGGKVVFREKVINDFIDVRNLYLSIFDNFS